MSFILDNASPIWNACNGGHKNIVRQILALEGDTADDRSPVGSTALDIALIERNDGIIKLLLLSRLETVKKVNIFGTYPSTAREDTMTSIALFKGKLEINRQAAQPNLGLTNILDFFGGVGNEDERCNLFIKIDSDRTIKIMKSIKTDILCRLCWKGHSKLLRLVTEKLSVTAEDIVRGNGMI